MINSDSHDIAKLINDERQLLAHPFVGQPTHFINFNEINTIEST